MIRVLHYGLSSNRGGIETYLDKVWTQINRNEFLFDFIEGKDNNEVCYKEKFTKMGSKFYPITSRKESIFRNRKELDELFRNGDFDIFHCHLNTLSYIEPINAAIRNNVPVILHSRSGNTKGSHITKTLHFLNARIIRNKVMTKLAVSNYAGDWLFGRKSDYLVINNGVDVAKFAFSKKDRIRIRSELNLESKFVIGNVGALNIAKNQTLLLDIFYEILKIKANSELLIVGDGNLREKLEKKANLLGVINSVRFLGNRSDISSLLSAMDVLVMPSLYEGFPNAVLEAQTSGLPCFLSDSITNQVKILDSCQYLSLHQSPIEWANVILGKIGEDIERESASQIVYDYGFSVDREIEIIEKIYKSIFEYKVKL